MSTPMSNPNWQSAETQDVPGWPTIKPPSKGLPGWAVLLLIVGGLLLLCVLPVTLTALASSDDPKPAPSRIATAQKSVPEAEAVPMVPVKPKASPTPAAPKMGQTLRVGNFSYVIHSKKCGLSQAGKGFLIKKPQGSYCRLDITVRNVTKKAQFFYADTMMSVTDTQGRTFSADGEAGVYGNTDGAGFISEINPGNQVRAYVFFDVSGGVKLASLKIDAGVFTTAKDLTVPLA